MKIDMYDEIPTTFGKFGPDHITGAIPMHCMVSNDLLIKELVNNLKTLMFYVVYANNFKLLKIVTILL